MLLVSSMMMTSCGEDDLDTNQYQQGVRVSAYGPVPVMRGGTLRFLGSNLEQISQVLLPGADPISNIEVVSKGSHSEIRVIVPHDNCSNGKVILVTNDGREIETKTPISYIEGLDPANITIPASAKPGELIRISVPADGDEYLDMIRMVEFAKGVRVGKSAFKSHTRYVIEVEVPIEAMTGKLNLYTADLTDAEEAESNTNYQIITTESVLEVSCATATKVTSPRGECAVDGQITAKQGETITMTGTFFNLVKSVKIGKVEITEINKASDTSLSFVVPADAADEAIALVCVSGVEVPVATLQTVTPSSLSAAPSKVKAGQQLTISGQDMDLVTGVEFAGAGAIASDNFTVEAGKVIVKSVPANATDQSPLVLRMANGKTVETAYALVVPVIASYDVTTVNAGSKISIAGSDLDLVTAVEFGAGIVPLADLSVSESAISCVVPMESTSGRPLFVLANGAKIEGPELRIEEAVFCYITELPTEDTKPDAGSVVTVPVKNGDKLTTVSVDGTEVNFVFDEKHGQITFGIPVATGSTGKVKLTSSNGEITYNMPVKPATEVEKVIFMGPVSIDWSSNRVYVEDAMLEGVPDNAVLHIEFTQHEAWGQVQINYADWTQIMFEGSEGGYIKTNTFNDKSISQIDLPLTAEILENLKSKTAAKGENHAIIIQGSDWTINKMSFKWENVLEKDLSALTANMNGAAIAYPYTLTWGDDGRFRLSKETLLNDVKVKKGSVLRVYKTAGSTGQVQINNSSWTAIDYLKDWNGDVELMEKEFDDAMMEAVEGGGLVIQGGLSGITKIAILP